MMANTNEFAFDFYLPSDVKAQNARDFGEENMRAEYKPHTNPAVDGYNPTDIYDKLVAEGKDAEAQKVLELFAIKQRTGMVYPGTDKQPLGAEKNYVGIELNAQQKPLMVIKNLGGTGLNFNIEDGQAVVFPKDAKLTPEQVKELAHFFYIQGIPTEGLENFMFPENEDLQVIDQDFNVSSFKESFETELTEVFQRGRAQQEALNGGNHWEGGTTSKEENVWGTPFQMAQKVKARMSIAAEDSAQIHCVRRDGGYYVYVYKDQKAADGDGVIDPKTGHRAETKTCGIFCTIENGVPKALIYTPSGKIDKNTTRYALEALKAVGCTHVKAPGAMDFGGAGMGTFWENCGKTLICPRVEPPKFTLDTGNVDELIAAIDKEKKNSEAKRNAFKKVVAKELRRQANIQAYQKKYNTSKIPSSSELAAFCRDVPLSERKSPDNDFEDKIAELEGVERFTNFKDFTNDPKDGIRGYFNQEIRGIKLDDKGNITHDENTEKGDAVDYIAAIYAYGEFISIFRENDSMSKYLPNNRAGLLAEYTKLIDKYKPKAAKAIQNKIDKNAHNRNYDDTKAVSSSISEAQGFVNDEIANTQRTYEHFKVYTNYECGTPDYEWTKYFQGKLNDRGKTVADIDKYKGPGISHSNGGNYRTPVPGYGR